VDRSLLLHAFAFLGVEPVWACREKGVVQPGFYLSPNTGLRTHVLEKAGKMGFFDVSAILLDPRSSDFCIIQLALPRG